MIGDVFALLHTLLDIVLLRRGPEALPRSTVLLLVCFGLWLFAGVVVTVVLYDFNFNSLMIDIVASIVGISCYVSVVVLYAKTDRLQQMLAALFGCGAILAVSYVGISSTLGALTNDDRIITVWLILGLWLWSVLLEGHILARTINAHWYFGIVIAMATFFLQFFVGSVLSPPVEAQAAVAAS